MTLPFADFNAVYQRCVSEVMTYYNGEMQDEMAQHNVAWSRGRTDFEQYLRRSAIRFYPVILSIEARAARRVCDVGGFWGVLPLTIKALGVDAVAMTEALTYYGSAFSPLFGFLERNGVSVHDFDPFGDAAWIESRFDYISLMAVLEHYPHSLKGVMAKVDGMLEPHGHIYIEVPNIAYLPKRVGLLRGHSPLPPIADIYQSEQPFIGHHHEFTGQELVSLCELSGFTAEQVFTYNYSTSRGINLSHGPRAFIESLASILAAAPYAVFPALRECVSGIFVRQSDEHPVHPSVEISPGLRLGFRDTAMGGQG